MVYAGKSELFYTFGRQIPIQIEDTSIRQQLFESEATATPATSRAATKARACHNQLLMFLIRVWTKLKKIAYFRL
jgi:hypothetical protein